MNDYRGSLSKRNVRSRENNAWKKKSSDLKAILCMFPLKALFLQLLLLLDASITTWKIFHVVEKWFIERN